APASAPSPPEQPQSRNQPRGKHFQRTRKSRSVPKKRRVQPPPPCLVARLPRAIGESTPCLFPASPASHLPESSDNRQAQPRTQSLAPSFPPQSPQLSSRPCRPLPESQNASAVL